MPERDPPATRRLFVALPLPADTARRLAEATGPSLGEAAGGPGAGLAIYAPGDLHLTLVFLGSLPEERLETLRTALREELRGLSAPELQLRGTGAFPSFARPRVLWAGVEEVRSDGGGPGRLAALRQRVTQAALCTGWRPARSEAERPFTPHLTLARVRRGPGGTSGLRAFEGLDPREAWSPVEVVLFESRPGPGEERYRPLASVPLVVRPG